MLPIGFLSFALFVVILFNQMSAPVEGHAEHDGGEEHAVDLPESWPPFSRTALVRGKEAIGEIDRLHGKSIKVHDGYRADYASPQEQFTLWVATVGSAAEARHMLDQMVDRIGPNNKMFSKPELVTRRGTAKMYRSEGMGQSHFYYAKGAAVYWVAVSSPDPVKLAFRIAGEIGGEGP